MATQIGTAWANWAPAARRAGGWRQLGLVEQVVEGVHQIAKLRRGVCRCPGSARQFRAADRVRWWCCRRGTVGDVDPSLQELIDLLAHAGGGHAAKINRAAGPEKGVDQSFWRMTGIVGVGNIVARHLMPAVNTSSVPAIDNAAFSPPCCTWMPYAVLQVCLRFVLVLHLNKTRSRGDTRQAAKPRPDSPCLPSPCLLV